MMGYCILQLVPGGRGIFLSGHNCHHKQMPTLTTSPCSGEPLCIWHHVTASEFLAKPLIGFHGRQTDPRAVEIQCLSSHSSSTTLSWPWLGITLGRLGVAHTFHILGQPPAPALRLEILNSCCHRFRSRQAIHRHGFLNAPGKRRPHQRTKVATASI